MLLIFLQSEQGLADELQKLKTSMASERKNTKEMILVLLEDRRKMATLYMEEKRRVDDMSRQLREEKSKVRALGMGLEEESKRSLAMEAELEHHLVQINSQADELQAERINGKELEDALRKARQDADHFKKQLSEAHRVAMSQASAAASPLYAHNAEALTASSIGLSPVPSAASISSSPMGGLTASSLVTAAMGKQSISGKYDSYSQKSRTSVSFASKDYIESPFHVSIDGCCR
jgi:chromosome segregation ATPase